ncbi:hypothetical protein Tco_1198462, partial [Tanacetum coccineum]
EDSTLSNHDTGEHPFPPLEKLTGAEPVSEPKTIKSILKSKSTFKAETLKGIIINEPSSAPARGNKGSSASKTNSAHAGPDLNRKAVNESQYKEKSLQMLVSCLKIKDHTLKRDIEFHFIPTQYQLADIFTKPLDDPPFKRLIVELGMLNMDSKPEASILTEEN